VGGLGAGCARREPSRELVAQGRRRRDLSRSIIQFASCTLGCGSRRSRDFKGWPLERLFRYVRLRPLPPRPRRDAGISRQERFLIHSSTASTRSNASRVIQADGTYFDVVAVRDRKQGAIVLGWYWGQVPAAPLFLPTWRRCVVASSLIGVCCDNESLLVAELYIYLCRILAVAFEVACVN